MGKVKQRRKKVKPTVIVADPLAPKVCQLLSKKVHLDYQPGIKLSDLKSKLRKADALILRSRLKVTEDLMKGSRLKVIGRAGTGVDNIDTIAATRSGILVMNTPGANSISAAEHTIAMMLAMMRNIPVAHHVLKSGVWDRKKYQGTELYGKTVGIIGLGRIGKEVAKRVKSFGAKIVAYDPYVSEAVAKELEVVLTNLKKVCKSADILTLHLPLTKNTVGFLNGEMLRHCKRGVRIVNCARGALLNEDALLKGLRSGKVAAAALDVFSEEPPQNKALIGHPAVVVTPHLSASTQEAQERVGIEIAEQIVHYLEEGVIKGAVNFPSLSEEEHARIAPYMRLAYLLGNFISQVSQMRLREIGIRYYGDLMNCNTKLISSAAIYGILRPFMSENANIVNARSLSEAQGIKIVETQSSRKRGLNNVLSLQLRGEKTEWVEGSVYPTEWRKDLFPAKTEWHELHIVSIDGIPIEAPLTPYILFLRNRDFPGVVGKVGTLLGKGKVNIANLALGRDAPYKHAVEILNLDKPMPAPLLQRLRRLKGVTYAQGIVLEET